MFINFKRTLGVVFYFSAFLGLGSCRNLFRDFSYNTSSDYILVEAEKHLNNAEYDEAINDVDTVLSREPTNTTAQYIKSLAHAGRGGLNVLEIFQGITDGGASSMFTLLSESFETVDDDDLSDLTIAVSYLETYGETPDDRSADENFYALFLYLGRIGAVINRYAYDSNNDLLNATFSGCHTQEDKAGVKTGIPDDDIDIIMTMLPRVISTLERLEEQGSGGFFDISTLQAVGTFSEDPIPCSDDSNDADCLAIRSIVNNNLTGVGLGTGGAFGESVACLAVTP